MAQIQEAETRKRQAEWEIAQIQQEKEQTQKELEEELQKREATIAQLKFNEDDIRLCLKKLEVRINTNSNSKTSSPPTGFRTIWDLIWPFYLNRSNPQNLFPRLHHIQLKLLEVEQQRLTPSPHLLLHSPPEPPEAGQQNLGLPPPYLRTILKLLLIWLCQTLMHSLIGKEPSDILPLISKERVV